MAAKIESVPLSAHEKAIAERKDWLRSQMDAIRARGHQPIHWDPITVKGEPVSVTIIRERRGDFDDDPLS
jgi:hypothetical protein